MVVGHWRLWCSLVRPSSWASWQCSCLRRFPKVMLHPNATTTAKLSSWCHWCCFGMRPEESVTVLGWCLSPSFLTSWPSVCLSPMRWLLCSSELAFGSLSRPQLYPWRPAVSPVNSPLPPDRPHRPSDTNLEIGGRPEICTQTEAEMDTNEDRWISRHAHADGCVLAVVICYPNRTDVNSLWLSRLIFAWFWYLCHAWQSNVQFQELFVWSLKQTLNFSNIKKSQPLLCNYGNRSIFGFIFEFYFCSLQFRFFVLFYAFLFFSPWGL